MTGYEHVVDYFIENGYDLEVDGFVSGKMRRIVEKIEDQDGVVLVEVLSRFGAKVGWFTIDFDDEWGVCVRGHSNNFDIFNA